MADAPLVTTATAVAVCLAIEKLTAKKPQIKWVNDIYLDGTKICGILTEAVSDFESGKIETLIVGIGLNVKEPLTGFPAELDTIAGSLMSSKETENINRNRLIAEIANQFDGIYQTIEERSFLADYKKRCFVMGKKLLLKNVNKSLKPFQLILILKEDSWSKWLTVRNEHYLMAKSASKSHFKRRLIMSKLTTREVTLSSLMAALTLISGYISLPFGPVPFTLQTLFVLLTGLMLQKRAAFLAQSLHLFLILIFKGFQSFLSPSFGFVIGFIVGLM